MLEEYGYNDYEERRAQASAQEFEQILRSRRFVFMDLVQVDEIFNYYVRTNEIGSAQKLIEYAIRSHPSSGDLYHKQARLDLELGHVDKALGNIDTALSYSPMTAEYVLFKADILARVDRYAEAVTLLEDFSGFFDHPEEVYLQMGNVAQICGKTDESERFYRKALALSPTYEDALYELAFLMESDERIEDAISLYHTFLDEFPYSSLVWLNLSMLYRKMGNFELALDALDYAIVVQDDLNSAWYHKGQLLQDMGRLPEALQAYLSAVSIQADDLQSIYSVADCYETLELFHEAYRYYRKATRLDPEYLEAWLGMGSCMEQRERYLEAINYYRRALQLDEENMDACLSLAVCEYKLGNHHSAYFYLEQALTANPQELSIWQDWAELLREHGNHFGAITYLEEALKIHSQEAELYFQIAAYCLETDQRDRGLMYLENGLVLDYESHFLLFHFDAGLMEDKEVLRMIESYA
ncbi:MAG: tetratricopeptide repeat protein [Bacteroidetes bacterium]|nr:MAG: tetratricopeptide repeat protein [Bacteroidota bacterium]